MPSPSAPVARWASAGQVGAGVNATSASITANAGDLLVLCCTCETFWAAGERNIAIAVSGVGTWTTDKDQDAGTSGGHASIHHVICPSNASFTISINHNDGNGQSLQLSAMVYKIAAGDFDAATPIGATGGGTGTTDPFSPSLYTSTVDNSRAIYCGVDYDNVATATSTDTEDAASYAGVMSVLSAFKAADTASSGTAVSGNFAIGATPYWTWAAVEVRPAGGAAGADLAGGAAATAAASGTLTPDQSAAPIADISAGAWLPSSGVALHPMVGEANADDGTAVWCPVANSAVEFGLASLADPAVSGGHTLYYRLSSPVGATFQITVKQSATQIAQWTQTSTPALAQYSRTLSAAEADAITDYTNLRVRIEAL